MRRATPSGSALRVAAAVAAAACAPHAAPPGEAGPAEIPRPAAYHAVVVWVGPARFDTVHVAFDARWERTPFGADTFWTFSGTERQSRRAAFGRLHRDSLTWGLVETVGDVTIVEEFSGSILPDGRASGCGGPLPFGAARTGTRPRAAFALAPAQAREPTAAEAPTDLCSAGPPDARR